MNIYCQEFTIFTLYLKLKFLHFIRNLQLNVKMMQNVKCKMQNAKRNIIVKKFKPIQLIFTLYKFKFLTKYKNVKM